jgi:hypothetical protein
MTCYKHSFAIFLLYLENSIGNYQAVPLPLTVITNFPLISFLACGHRNDALVLKRKRSHFTDGSNTKLLRFSANPPKVEAHCSSNANSTAVDAELLRIGTFMSSVVCKTLTLKTVYGSVTDEWIT